jgi:hypothetical protein
MGCSSVARVANMPDLGGPEFESQSEKRPARLWGPPPLQWIPCFSPGGKEGLSLKLNTHPHLLPRIRMSGSIPPPLWFHGVLRYSFNFSRCYERMIIFEWKTSGMLRHSSYSTSKPTLLYIPFWISCRKWKHKWMEQSCGLHRTSLPIFIHSSLFPASFTMWTGSWRAWEQWATQQTAILAALR